MKKLLVFLICWAMLVNPVFSQALPVSKMQSAISGVIQQKAIKRGFAANDPRYAATLSKVGTGLGLVAGTAASIAVGTITAPAWATVILVAGAGAFVSYAVTLGIDGLVNWLFNSNSIDVSGTATNSGIPGLAPGAPAFQAATNDANGRGTTIYGGDNMALARQAFYGYAGVGTALIPSCGLNPSGSVATCIRSPYSANATRYTDTFVLPNCPSGHYSVNGSGCVAYTFPPPGAAPAPNQTPQQAVDSLSAVEKAKKLNPALVAETANLAWRNAASQPGYDGLPYSAADPITPAEAVQWQTANPDRYPTVGDFVAPQPASNKPWSIPPSATAPTQSTDTNPSSGINPSTQPQTNLGVDPVTPPPVIEEPPTSEQILAPILNMLPGFNNFSVPSHAAECPKPSFDLFDKQYVMNSHCVLFEDNRQFIASLMAAVWSLTAVFIVLRA